MEGYKNFNPEAFKQWYNSQAQELFDITGIAHWNAPDARFLKILYIQEQRIKQLEERVNTITRNNKDG